MINVDLVTAEAHDRKMTTSLRYAPTTRLESLWSDVGGSPTHLDRVTTGEPEPVLPSVFDVTGFAVDTVAVALLAVAELWATRTGGDMPTTAIDRRSASASFKSDALLRAVGWDLPPIWDPVAGDYRTADGWIRLHTNYPSHRRAALEVLGTPPIRDSVADAVRTWIGDDLESAVVNAGGCAATMRTQESWRAHPAGQATSNEHPIGVGEPVTIGGHVPHLATSPEARPLEGIRVLDLTRVIAGPVATRLLAGYGADVIRIDPPGFEEVGALLPDMTAGKRCVALDLTSTPDRDRFLELLADAHVVVGGLRPGALAALDLDVDSMRGINPSIITVSHDAYGWDGPWSQRRGFDSLVQMSTGIAATGMAEAGVEHPVPLPAQALDHGIGHLLAGATCRALVRLATTGCASDVRGSLVGAANAVIQAPTPGGLGHPAPLWTDRDTVEAQSAWGPLRRVPLAGHVNGHEPSWSIEAGPLSLHAATWS